VRALWFGSTPEGLLQVQGALTDTYTGAGAGTMGAQSGPWPEGLFGKLPAGRKGGALSCRLTAVRVHIYMYMYIYIYIHVYVYIYIFTNLMDPSFFISSSVSSTSFIAIIRCIAKA
jgi:hypothetical protein